MKLSESEINDLKVAKRLLENPGIAVKIANIVGKPIEKGFTLLPEGWSLKVSEIARLALTKAVDGAVFTMKDASKQESSNKWHKVFAAVSGGVGGAFGLAAVAVEFPVTTTIMMRSIVDIARSEGADIKSLDTKLACIEVFALGGKDSGDDEADSGYYAVRAAMSKSIADAAASISKNGFSKEGAPFLVDVISKVAAKFSIPLSEKVAAQAIPVIGGAGGAIINTLFIDHYQDMAKGHFIVKRLEKNYGKEYVEEIYKSLSI